MPAGTVEVLLLGATGIKDTERFGKADPYGVLKCGKQTLRSNVATNQGSKPVWNQKFSFYIDDSVTELHIKILNHNIFTEDDEIGSTTIPLARIFAEGKLPTTSYNVVRPSGRVQGEVKLSLTYTPKKKPGSVGVPTPVGSVAGSLSSGFGSSHGPYSSRTSPGPYRQPEPVPTHKHDPLTGPNGYFKVPSAVGMDTSTAPPYGSGVGVWATGASVGGSSTASSDGSGRPGPPGPPGYGGATNVGPYPPQPSNVYPHVGASTNQSTTYPNSGERYMDSTSVSGRTNAYPQASTYPHKSATDYGAGSYQPSPYESSHYHPGGMPGAPSYASSGHYGIDNITAGVSGMGISGHGSADGYKPHQIPPPTRPPGAHYEQVPGYPGYVPAPAHYDGRPGADYGLPGGYPPASYPTEGSNYGRYPVSEYQSGYPPAGYPPAGYPPNSSSHGGPLACNR